MSRENPEHTFDAVYRRIEAAESELSEQIYRLEERQKQKLYKFDLELQGNGKMNRYKP